MSTPDGKWDREIDLKGEVCPFTFVKTKLALEEMSAGEVLRVILDYPESVDSVPRSAQGEGHDVLAVEQIGEGQWAVKIRKA
ncbi:MAG: sulfurtransferase TusA family protein [Chloroflexota bacterium]